MKQIDLYNITLINYEFLTLFLRKTKILRKIQG
jgi:hypothetical protein